MRGHPTRTLAFFLAVTVVLGCATGNRPAGTSGFLGDYSNLDEGRGNQARLVYIDLAADFSAYDSIIVDSIVVWDAEEAGPSRAPAVESRQQADYFQRVLREQLQDVYKLVEAPQSGTLRLRVAIVEGLGAGVNIECELTDSASRKRLVAAVDHRKLSALPGDPAAVADGKRIYDRWAEIIRNRLAALRDFDASQKEADAVGSD